MSWKRTQGRKLKRSNRDYQHRIKVSDKGKAWVPPEIKEPKTDDDSKTHDRKAA